MIKKLILAVIASSAFVALPALAQDASIDQVYQAAKAGRFSDADAMMTHVLHDHPNSAKAHFVEAELLGKEGKYSEARAELQTAQTISPGLPQIDAQSVQNLNRLLDQTRTAPRYSPPGSTTPMLYQQPRSGFPWGLFISVLLIVGVISLIVRAFRRPNGAVVMQGGYGPNGMPGYGYGPGGVPMGGPMGGMGMGMGGGMGSGILGGLATGAAVGAGVVAGEELMHHFTDGNQQGGYMPQNQPYAQPDNMGGQDFGVADSSSWDDGGGGGGGVMGGGGDWN